MNEINKVNYQELKRKRKKVAFIIVAIVAFGYVVINFVFNPYFTTSGKEARLWDEQEKKMNDILKNACSLKTDNPLYIKLKTECEKRKRGECPFKGIKNDLYCPSNYSAEPPEPRPFGN